MTGKKNRVEISIKKKLEIIKEIEGNPKQTFSSIAKKFHIDPSTVSKIFKKKDILLSGAGNVNRKRQRFSKVINVDEALHKWFIGATSTNLPINGEILRTKAEGFATKLGIVNFSATNGWLDRWKKRYSVVYKRFHGEKADADFNAAEFWLSHVLTEVIRRYKPENIYNADETGLYWRALPNGSHVFKENQLAGCKIAKDRVTLLICASMVGEKRPLLMISKSKMPRCFQGLKSLPLDYQHNNKAWMTSTIFERWLRTWDQELSLTKQKVALILDNCTAHPKLELSNIELFFLPPNVTALIQPCDQGIIRSLKFHYRRLIVLKLLAALESTEQNLSAIQLVRQIDLLCATRLIKDSWETVAMETIVNGFKKAKMCNDDHVILENEDMYVSANDFDFNFDTFVDVDQDLECFEPLNDDTIIESIIEKSSPNKIEDSDEEDSGTELMIVNKDVALKSLQMIQLFLSRSGNQNWNHFNQLETQLQRIIVNNASRAKQLTLDSWFKNSE